MPLGRHGSAVAPGLKAQRGEGDPKPWADGVGSERCGVTWLGCTWTTSREMRDEESFLRPHQETCTGSKCTGKSAPKQSSVGLVICQKVLKEIK